MSVISVLWYHHLRTNDCSDGRLIRIQVHGMLSGHLITTLHQLVNDSLNQRVTKPFKMKLSILTG